MEREIVQIVQCEGRVHALCNDGTILYGYGGRWHILDLGPIPQPDEEKCKEEQEAK